MAMPPATIKWWTSSSTIHRISRRTAQVMKKMNGASLIPLAP